MLDKFEKKYDADQLEILFPGTAGSAERIIENQSKSPFTAPFFSMLFKYIEYRAFQSYLSKEPYVSHISLSSLVENTFIVFNGGVNQAACQIPPDYVHKYLSQIYQSYQLGQTLEKPLKNNRYNNLFLTGVFERELSGNTELSRPVSVAIWTRPVIEGKANDVLSLTDSFLITPSTQL